MSKKTSAIIIWTLALTLLVLNCTSCGVVSQVTGNPEPNLKSVHFAITHDGYTKEEYDAHPDWDCTTYRLEPIYANGYLMGYKRINIRTGRID